MFLRQFSLHNRTYGMQDITARQIVGFRDLRLSGGFLMPLFFHHPGAVQSQLHPRKAVDAVVDALMIRHITSGHSTVGGIDDGIAL